MPIQYPSTHPVPIPIQCPSERDAQPPRQTTLLRFPNTRAAVPALCAGPLLLGRTPGIRPGQPSHSQRERRRADADTKSTLYLGKR